MLTEGIKVINRKEVDWVDDGGYEEPYLQLKVGDIKLIEAIIKATKEIDCDFAKNLVLEYEELTKIRMQKRKDYGDLPVPAYIDDLIIEDLEQEFINPDVDRECNEDDVYEAYDGYQKHDWDVPTYFEDFKRVQHICNEVNEYVREQRVDQNAELLREYYQSVL